MKYSIFFVVAGFAFAQNAAKTYSVLPGGKIQFFDSQSTPHTVALLAPSSVASNVSWVLPSADAAGPLCSNGSGALSFNSCAFQLLLRTTDPDPSRLEYRVTGSLVDSWYLGTLPDEDNSAISQFSLSYGGSGTTLWRVRQDGSLFTRNLSPIVGTTSALGTTGNRWNHTWTNYLTVTDPASGSGGVNSDLRPRITDSIELGGASYRWGKIYAKEIDISGTCTGSACGGFSTTTTHTWTASQTFSTADLLAAGTSNIGTGAAPWIDIFGTNVYGTALAVAKPGTAYATSYKWQMNAGLGLNGLYLYDPGPTNVLLYEAPTVDTRALKIKGHFLSLADTQTWDIGGEWPLNEWRNVYAYGIVQGGSFRIRTGNGTSTEVISSAQDVTAADVYVARSGVSRVNIYNGGPSGGGIVQTYNAAGDTVLNKLDQTGASFSNGGAVFDSAGVLTITGGAQLTSSSLKIHPTGDAAQIWMHDDTMGGVSGDWFPRVNGGSFQLMGNDYPALLGSAVPKFAVAQTGAVTLNGTTVIDASRNGALTSLTINGSTFVDSLRNLYVASCTGCLSNLAQSITFAADNTYAIGSTSYAVQGVYSHAYSVYRSSTDLRVSLLPGGPTGSGTISLYDYLGSVVNSMTSSGINTTIGFNANGNAGLSATFNPSTCSSVTFTFGILTSKSGC